MIENINLFLAAVILTRYVIVTESQNYRKSEDPIIIFSIMKTSLIYVWTRVKLKKAKMILVYVRNIVSSGPAKMMAD